MEAVIRDLIDSLSCEVLQDHISRVIYSNDASIYEITPLAIVIPRTKEDIIKTVQIASKHKVPLTARGAATGITGGAIGTGIIIDTSKHLSKIIEINEKERYAIVQPGVVQDGLNNRVSNLGLRLGPDTSTGNRATLAGMVANNAAGAHSLHFGSMIDHVIEVELVLSTGEIVRLKEDDLHATNSNNESKLSKEVTSIVSNVQKEIDLRYPAMDRVSSGYRLDKIVHNGKCNLAKLICGSEGTLGIITELTVKLSEKPLHTSCVIIAMQDLIQSVNEVHQLLEYNPYSLEMIDRKIITAALKNPSLKDKIHWLQSIPDALFAVELTANTQAECQSIAHRVLQTTQKFSHHLWSQVLTNQQDISSIWEVRKQGLGLLLSKRSFSRAIAFIEDVAVPPSNMGKFIKEFNEILHKHHKEAGIYGHVGAGCLHIRPYIDTRSPDDLKTMQSIMNDVMKLLQSLKGAMSSEHGDGIVRSNTTKEMFGEKLFEAFKEIKKLFDPDNLMNPGKIIPNQELLDNLRLNPDTKHIEFPSSYTYADEGGLELTVDLCNGNGQCRKLDGVMCPSFQATHNEKDSTRARANALRGILHGKISFEEARKPEFYDVFDLCLQCKGCKTECPSQVDIAKVKSDYLHFYHSYSGFPLSSYLFGFIGSFLRFGSITPRFINWLTKTKLARHLQSLGGITPHRTMPLLANSRFSELISSRNLRLRSKKAALFVDTFTEFYTPHIAMMAIDIMEKMGYEVIPIPWTCCGRTLFSKGFIPQAKEYAKKLLNTLIRYAKEGIPIIGLEPSCLFTIKDEYRDGFLPDAQVSEVIKYTMPIDEFLFLHADELVRHLKPHKSCVHVHTHCHQKALGLSIHILNLLSQIPGITAQEIPAGCCGMAGSFGYEKEHFHISQKVAELHLIPYLNSLKEDDIVIASGFSCASQIKDLSGHKSLHIVEYIHNLLT